MSNNSSVSQYELDKNDLTNKNEFTENTRHRKPIKKDLTTEDNRTTNSPIKLPPPHIPYPQSKLF